MPTSTSSLEPLAFTLAQASTLLTIGGSSVYPLIECSSRPLLCPATRRLNAFAPLRGLVAVSHEAAQ